MLSLLGSVALLVAAVFLVSVGWGESSSTTSGPDGVQVTETHRSASALESSPGTAVRWLTAAAAFALVATLLIRFGGRIGGGLVVVVTGLGIFASMLTIGIFLAPGAALLGAAAVVAEADRAERRRLATLPPPPRFPVASRR